MEFMHDYSSKFEYSVGLSLSDVECKIIDDFSFSFLAPEQRRSGFLTSYFPSESSYLPFGTVHASGITVPVMLTPFSKVLVPLGCNISFLDRELKSTDLVTIGCGDEFVRPPLVYLGKPVVHIPCFNDL